MPRFEQYTSAFSLSNTLYLIDFFKQPLPSFHVRGRSFQPSFCGGFASILITLIVIVYGLSTFIQMLHRQNPNVSSFLGTGVLDSSTAIINFRDRPIRIAFGIEGFLDRELKDDNTYVKILS